MCVSVCIWLDGPSCEDRQRQTERQPDRQTDMFVQVVTGGSSIDGVCCRGVRAVFGQTQFKSGNN